MRTLLLLVISIAVAREATAHASANAPPFTSLSNKQCDGLSVAEVLKRDIQ
jgi:hypothetical protein